MTRSLEPHLEVCIGGAGAWASKVLGIDKRQLLIEVLRDVARNRALQRLASDFQDMLYEAQKPREHAALATCN
jgi:hypothetical protein